MPKPSRVPLQPPSTPGLGDPAYSLLAFAAGSLLQVGTQATAYVNSFALAPRDAHGQAVTA